jgi:hypothetical protein
MNVRRLLPHRFPAAAAAPGRGLGLYPSAMAIAVPGLVAPGASRGETPVPAISAGAWELGLTGALTSVEGDTRWSLGIDGARFLPLGGGFAAPGAELVYSHQNALDLLAVGAGIVWLRRWGRSPVYPYLGPGAGFRQEWIGSFRTTRYPVGADLGLRVMVSEGALLRVEYRFRRILGDPVAGYTEHRVGVGVALVLGAPPAGR